MLIGHKELQEDFIKLSKEHTLAHGYIFYGPSRVGKKMFAAALARFLEQGIFSPENEERPVLNDALLVTHKEKTIGIDVIREIRTFLELRPNVSPYRTLILADGQFLTPEAQNALLKIAEEPHPNSLLIITIDDPDKLLPTLQSRFQKIFFPTVAPKEIEKWLGTHFKLSKAKATDLASRSFGLPGLAWSLEFDENFQTRLEYAQKFLKSPGGRKELTKELVEDDTFDLGDFLEALMIVAAGAGERNGRFWHAALDLARQAETANINPRLQLMALGQFLI